MFSFMSNFNVQSTVAAFCLSIGRCAEQPLRRGKVLRALFCEVRGLEVNWVLGGTYISNNNRNNDSKND